MKMQNYFTRIFAGALALGCTISSFSCMTTYDANGRPIQSVDPVVAVAGVAAAGLIGYAAGNDNRYYRGGGYYHRPHYRRGYYYR